MVNSNMAIAEIELKGNGSSLDYVLTLDPNGGFIHNNSRNGMPATLTTKPYRLNVRFNQEIGVLPTPIRPGYRFEGWFKTKSGFWPETSDYPYTQKRKLDPNTIWLWKRDATFEAGWTAESSTLIWDSNDGSASPERVTVEGVPLGSVLGGVVDEDGVPYVSKVPFKEGYSFLGWFTHFTHGVKVNEYTNVEAQKIGDIYKKTYYAHWNINEYTATFDANGGLGGKQITQLYGLPLYPPSVTREGYTFDKWEPTPPSTMPGEDATYVAQWNVNYYTVTFDANGGEGGVTKEIAYDYPIDEPKVTRTGYSFMGWDSKVPEKMPA